MSERVTANINGHMFIIPRKTIEFTPKLFGTWKALVAYIYIYI